MKINNNMLSIPPYISTSWRDVQSLHTREGLLVVSLFNGETVEIPDLKLETIQDIFSAHETFLEHHGQEGMVERMEAQNRLPGNMIQAFLTPQQLSEMPMRMNINSLENMGMVLQHNPAQANTPDLPPEMLEKIASFAKMISPEEQEALPKAEPHCNCAHCQIARTISKSLGQTTKEEPEVEIVVADEDLKFRQWEIAQIGDKLFRVTNPLDHNEHYNVFLGEPVGCTCGHQGCEHVIAVLQS